MSDSRMAGEVADEAYVELSRRLARVSSIGALIIHVLLVVSVWGQWRHVALVIASNCVLIPINIWITLVLLKRRGPVVGEAVRAFVNFGAGVVTSHILRWPLPVWLWLPYVALVFDHLHPRVSGGTLVALCVVNTAVALHDGVSFQVPLVFVALAALCWHISRVRFSAIREMLLESNRARRELASAHESTRKAHANLELEMKAREQAELTMRQAQKLEAVGRLAAGIAHEINTPVQYVSDNVQFVNDSFGDLVKLLDAHRAAIRAMRGGASLASLTAELAEEEERASLDYLLEEIPEAMTASLGGLERIATIVRSMKEFAHPDGRNLAPADVNRGILSTLAMARGEYKYVADVITELDELPLVECNLGEVNQAVLNIVVNAAQAIGEANQGTGKRGHITVRSRHESGCVRIEISDDGPGIPHDLRDRIFDPFFTTKDVGYGTGQGLAVVRSVMEGHAGSITFESEEGRGTTFVLEIPVTHRVRSTSSDRAPNPRRSSRPVEGRA